MHRHLLVPMTLVIGSLCGCFTVTNERPDYQELGPDERSAVDVVLRELNVFESRLKATRGCSVAEIVNREKIDVSFEGLIVAGNLGDTVIHLAVWENLSAAQKAMVQRWFGVSTEAEAATTYKKFFYQFLGVTQGAKEFIYKALEVSWLLGHRSLFNLEKDAVRIAVAHYDDIGRGAEMRAFLNRSCAPLLKSQAATWGPRYENGKDYLKDPFHLEEFYKPEAPVGYLYFVCRWAKLAMEGPEFAEGLGAELDWILSLRSRRCQAGSVINIGSNSS